jgi:D-3-phosphoglycerate dehydrogenase
LIHGAAVTAEMLDAAPELRLVACARGGPVNVDVAAATQRGIPVVTTPGKNADAVAELAIGFMLMLARGLPNAQAAAERATGASAFEGAEFFGRELAGRRLGLVGFGHVGRALAMRATGLAMVVSAFDPYQPVDRADVEAAEDLHELLAESDVVSLHARATPENGNLMSGPEFAAMRAGSLFLNTARDSLVDEPALAAALRAGHLAGAALDVVRSPADGHDPTLRTMRNVVITPHIGGATAETLDRGIAMLVAELDRLTRGEPLRNVANPTVVAV